MFNYQPRLVNALAILQISGYQFKLYEIVYQQEGVDSTKKVDTAFLRKTLSQHLSVLDKKENGYGFIILHYARDGVYLLASHWYDGNMLKHQVFKLIANQQGWEAVSLAPEQIIACVWELKLINFERDLWVEKVMATSGALRSLEKYLITSFVGVV